MYSRKERAILSSDDDDDLPLTHLIQKKEVVSDLHDSDSSESQSNLKLDKKVSSDPTKCKKVSFSSDTKSSKTRMRIGGERVKGYECTSQFRTPTPMAIEAIEAWKEDCDPCAVPEGQEYITHGFGKKMTGRTVRCQ